MAGKKKAKHLGSFMRKCARKWRKFKCSPAGKSTQKTWRGYIKSHCAGKL